MATVRELITKLGFRLDKSGLDRANKGAEKVKKGMEQAGQAGEKAGDKISSGAKRGANALDSEAEAARRAGKEIDTLSSKAKKLGDKGSALMMGGAQVAAAGAGMLAPLAAAAAQGMDFDYAMTRFAAVALSDKKGADFDAAKQEMVNLARQKGRDTIFDADEVANAMYYMGMAGWKSDQIKASLQDVLNLAVISGADLATVSDIITDDLTAMGMGADKAGEMVNMLAAVSTNANTDVLKMGETMKYVGAVAGSLGMEFRDVAIASGIMASAGTKADQAGTALRATMLRLLDPPKDAADALATLGVSAIDEATGEMKPFMKLVEELRAAMDGMSKAEKTELSAAISGRYAAAGFASLMTAKPEDIAKITNAIDTSNDGTGAGQQFADVMGGTLKNKIKGVESAIKELSLIISDNFGDVLMRAADTLRSFVLTLGDWIRDNPAVAKTLMAVTGALGGVMSIAGSVAVAVGGLMSLWGVIGPALTAGWTAISASAAPLIAIIAGIASVLYYAYENWDEIYAYMEPGLGRLRAGIDALSEAWSSMSPIVLPLLEAIAELVGMVLIRNLKNLFTVATFVFNEMAYLVKTLAGIIESVVEKVKWLVNGLKDFAGSAGSVLAGIGNTISTATSNVTINNEVSVNSPEEAVTYTDGSGRVFAAEP